MKEQEKIVINERRIQVRIEPYAEERYLKYSYKFEDYIRGVDCKAFGFMFLADAMEHASGNLLHYDKREFIIEHFKKEIYRLELIKNNRKP